jgi:alkane 1-monooxygenase
MQALRFAGPFGFLLSIPALYGVSAAAPLLTPLAILLTLLATEQIGRATPAHRASSGAFRLLPILYIPAQLAVLFWAANVAASPSNSLTAFASLAVSVGACMGVFGMLAAHEMVHGRWRWEQRLGLLMLFCMSYPHFRIVHVYGHHRTAATERDASTARLNESFYRFLLRTLPAQIFIAWRYERRRTPTRSAPLLYNRVIQGAVLLALVYGLLLIAQPMSAAFLAAESAVAIMVLELFNYVAHYGLLRHVNGEDVEAITDRHSWNSSGAGNLLIFNMGRHSDHHRQPASSYERLRSAPRAPELPLGYAGSIIAALVPPLWRAVMNPRIKPHAAEEPEPGYAGESPAAAIS